MTSQSSAISSVEVVVDEETFARRVIEPSDFHADTSAFVDVRLPESVGKASYSFIGPGVSQNSRQTINLAEPHGFNMGAASMPHGVINNPHLHYTAEVFICTAGEWRMLIGENGEQELLVRAGDVFAAPTWVFRGFQNVGDDDGFLHVVLGGDDTGGIIWAPEVLARAADTGLHLAPDHSVVEASNGAVPDGVLRPIPADELRSVDHYTDDELRRRLVRPDELCWSDRALLSSVADGHACSIAPVIGFGMTQDRLHRPPIWNPHGFSLEWLRVGEGQSTGRHRHGESQALLVVEGQIEVALNDAAHEVARTPANGSIVSIPAGAWRDLRAVGGDALVAVVNGGDAPNRLEWSAECNVAAFDAGWAVDAGGHLAPVALLGRPS